VDTRLRRRDVGIRVGAFEVSANGRVNRAGRGVARVVGIVDEEERVVGIVDEDERVVGIVDEEERVVGIFLARGGS
jgi:hypothetical protein